MRLTCSFLVVLAAAFAMHAAENPVVPSKAPLTLTTNLEPYRLDNGTFSNSVIITSAVLKHPVEDVRAALDVFMSQSRTNNRHGWFTPLGVQALASTEEHEFQLTVCSCNTPSPCYQIQAVRRSALETRLSVRALGATDGDAIHQFRVKRDQRIVDDLTAILEAKR